MKAKLKRELKYNAVLFAGLALWTLLIQLHAEYWIGVISAGYVLTLIARKVSP